MIDFSSQEWAFRRARYEQLRAAVVGLDEKIVEVDAERQAGRDELDGILAAFADAGDPVVLKKDLDVWSRAHRSYGFAAMNGAMFLNQLVNDSDPDVIGPLLEELLPAPVDDAEAARRFSLLTAHVEGLRDEGSAAAVGRVGALLSWFWWIDDPEQWPAMFTTGAKALNALGFLTTSTDQWERYADFRRHVVAFGSYTEVEQAFGIPDISALGLDPSASQRCASISTMALEPDEDDGSYAANLASVRVLNAMVEVIGPSLEDVVAEILGVSVGAHQPTEFWHPGKKRLRQDIWVSWRPQIDGLQPFVMLLVDADGVKIGLYASYQQTGGKGFLQRTKDLLEGREPEGLEWLPWGPEPTAYHLLGRRYDIDALTDRAAVVDALTSVVAALQPCVELIWEAEGSRPGASTPEPVNPVEADSKLLSLREEFLLEEQYPTERDEQKRADRVRFAGLLAADRLAAISREDLNAIYSGGGYGHPGPQANLHRTLNDGGEQVVDRFLTAINYLLWDEVDDVKTRINRVMDEDDLGLPGFKESVILKLLAIAFPERMIPVFPFTGDKGKAALLQVLDRTPPPLTLDVASRHLQANDALREATEPLFPTDPWAQMRFLYWLQEREQETGAGVKDPVEVGVDRIGQAAEKLHFDRAFLEEIHQLLSDHKQVVFYGPPGTGKTYVAQHLAEAITSDDQHRMLIQFHPSTSYEDFFEGFRPGQSGDGSIAYSLVDGPLRIMAQRAAADTSGRPHVLIVDEINRANLAKVLGELLFLLEYREAEIRPLYRPEEPFKLPENLWIIGTMNTADRSIATVDVALRRRFQFVPFVPDDREDNPISGLLRRWLLDNGESEEVADLVDGVNQRLRKEIGGNHLLLGPSYFMRTGLDEASLRLIWDYQIQPLVDDLFFGSAKAEEFRFEKVWREFGPGALES